MNEHAGAGAPGREWHRLRRRRADVRTHERLDAFGAALERLLDAVELIEPTLPEAVRSAVEVHTRAARRHVSDGWSHR